MRDTVSMMEVLLVTLGVMWTVFAYLLGRSVGATRAYRYARDLLQDAVDSNHVWPGTAPQIESVLDILKRRSE